MSEKILTLEATLVKGEKFDAGHVNMQSLLIDDSVKQSTIDSFLEPMDACRATAFAEQQ